MKNGRSPVEAVAAALPRLRGAFAVAFLFAGENDLIIGARKGSPLAIGYGDGEMYLGSDAIALAPFTDAISYLEEGDSAVLTRKSVEVRDAKGSKVERAVLRSSASAFLVDKGNYRHFMAKEIHEQPEVVGHTLAHYIDMAAERVRLPAELPFDFSKLERVSISACGTAYYAGLVAKYWFERLARLPVEIDVASEVEEGKLARALIETPRLMAEALALEPEIEHFARDLAKSRNVLYLGRGTSFPVALEGALKLKEISYIHAEGYAAGELKHGPIALIDENMPVVVIAPFDRVFEKTVSNMQEVAARGGNIILMTDAKGAAEATIESLVTIVLPDMAAAFTPMVYAIPVQLLAYHTAVVMGTDVDQPRNLAKSVTVE